MAERLLGDQSVQLTADDKRPLDSGAVPRTTTAVTLKKVFGIQRKRMRRCPAGLRRKHLNNFLPPRGLTDAPGKANDSAGVCFSM